MKQQMPKILKYFLLIGAALAVLLFTALIATFCGLRQFTRGNVARAHTLFRLATPISWTASRLSFRSVETLEVWYALNLLFTQGGKYLVLLQNSDEIRATGGFIGSYAVLDLDSAEPLRLEIRDMYDPSGISQTLPSPPGQAEYLSEGRGMKLIDANWNPDFPTSAKQILQYFAVIPDDPQTFTGVIALPLTTIESLINSLGGVYLVDQQQMINGDDLATVIRQDREQFFAGSKEKAQSLQALYTALKLSLNQLSLIESWQLWQSMQQAKFWQEIQVFAQTAKLQNALDSAQLTGALMNYQPQDVFVFPVESNVGINKANRKVSRHLTARLKDQQLILTTKFQNDFTKTERPVLSADSDYAVAPHLAYVNYYRLLTRPDMKVEQIKINGEPVATWDDTEITSAAGLVYRQIGFLVVVLEQKQTEVQIEFSVPVISKPRLIIPRQVGLRYTSITDSIE
ncbi:MAG: hypothetical protein A2383_01425 [Candidatus Pacebacteria bacterium RIFOXYB1_FULL_39_46]|nr:MAG: hypothetical protein A2383_01425 [Candidatus Pacebacteria bacterium RIFOXYB1_FULL_39_46]OGJ39051.1 MAG: hypothetical protein A2182_01845 [Candidatus Pacebacteria bacterium RIFOXYA1_FULL_38_18]OGJ40022.1 MAG: hypothetical protein A2582_01370 [Candidatus Pacebacteria bacterium RIFOXYD1_FULL_39_27]OGJ40716.1 MAG: hypothetical protein A2411_00325 [Candidatus Pacebacteria bacterium RIFOXYC1_FULL_39_21]